MALELLFWGAFFTGGGLALMAAVGITWGVIEDWQRERRWNRDARP